MPGALWRSKGHQYSLYCPVLAGHQVQSPDSLFRRALSSCVPDQHQGVNPERTGSAATLPFLSGATCWILSHGTLQGLLTLHDIPVRNLVPDLYSVLQPATLSWLASRIPGHPPECTTGAGGNRTLQCGFIPTVANGPSSVAGLIST